MAGLKAKKMIYIMNGYGTMLTEELNIELHDVGGGCEGGDFDDLDIIFNSHQEALEQLDVGDRIEIHAFHKMKDKKEWMDMFGDNPIIIDVVDKNGQKAFKLRNHVIGSAWCYNAYVEYK